jgi:hypothetical protein
MRLALVSILASACAQAAAPGLHARTDDTGIDGTFYEGGSGVAFRATGDDAHATLALEINGKELDLSIDLETQKLVEDAHGNTFDASDRAILLALRDVTQAEHPEWRETLRGALLVRAADRYAAVPLGRARELRTTLFGAASQLAKGDQVTTGCGGDGVACLPGTSGKTWAIFSSGGTCRAEETPYGDGVCRGRCGVGCSWWDEDYTWDCLDHDVCLDYSNDCSDEFNDAMDDWAVTFGPYCSSGSLRPEPQFVPKFKRVVGVHSGKCLDVEWASGDNGGNVHLWSCVNGAGNQQWKISPLGGGYVQVQVQHSGKCLDVSNGDTNNGARVQQWDCVGNTNQRWTVKPVGDAFALVSAVSGKCLDVDGWGTGDGTKVQLWDCHYGGNQLWR